MPNHHLRTGLMRIALDYDGTYTRDPEMWDTFIAMVQERGHIIVILTMRYPDEAVAVSDGVDVIYTSRKAKSEFYKADIYIDDTPCYLLQDAIP